MSVQNQTCRYTGETNFQLVTTVTPLTIVLNNSLKILCSKVFEGTLVRRSHLVREHHAGVHDGVVDQLGREG